MTTTTQTRSTRRSRRLLVKTCVVGVATASLLTATAASASASAVHATISSRDTPAQRDCYHPSKQPYPGTTCTLIQTLPKNLSVTLICQKDGQNISGDVWWDYVLTPGGVYGYVSDYYVNTGSSSYRVPGVDYCNY